MKLEERAAVRDLLKRRWIESSEDLDAMFLGRLSFSQLDAAFGKERPRSTAAFFKLPGSSSALLVLTRTDLLLFHARSARWEAKIAYQNIAPAACSEAALDVVFVGDVPPRIPFDLKTDGAAKTAADRINSRRRMSLDALPPETRINQLANQADALAKLNLANRSMTVWYEIAESGLHPWAESANLAIGWNLLKRDDVVAAEHRLLNAQKTGRQDTAGAAAALLGLIALDRGELAQARRWAEHAEHAPNGVAQSLRSAIDAYVDEQAKSRIKRSGLPPVWLTRSGRGGQAA